MNSFDAEILERWPHLRQPGPQPWNAEVADTAQEQFARALAPRQIEPADIEVLVEKIVRRILVSELPEAVAVIVGGLREANA